VRDPLQLALDQLENAMEVTAPEIERELTALVLPDLGLRVSIADLDVRENGTVIVYDATPFEGERILILAVGRAETLEQQLAETALQWTTGVFSALQHWLAPSRHSCFVGDVEFAIGDSHWRLHAGPLISRSWGDEDEDDGAARIFGPRDIPMVLFGAISGELTNRRPCWIEAFAVNYDDGTVDVTCRLNNEKWAEGEESLHAWASDWELPPDVTVTARQFLLYEPIAAPKKSWWQRLVGR
jgi:hypothetical protein